MRVLDKSFEFTLLVIYVIPHALQVKKIKGNAMLPFNAIWFKLSDQNT